MYISGYIEYHLDMLISRLDIRKHFLSQRIVHYWNKLPDDIALLGTPSQSYETSLAIWDHTVLPATRHK